MRMTNETVRMAAARTPNKNVDRMGLLEERGLTLSVIVSECVNGVLPLVELLLMVIV